MAGGRDHGGGITAMTIRGHVDEISHTSVSGWSFAPGEPARPIAVRILVNGILAAECAADQTRKGLSRHLGEGATDEHAFIFKFNPPLSPSRDHEIEVIEAITGQTIASGRKTLYSSAAGRSPLVPILVTSRGRSGTTLLMNRLMPHPEISVAGIYPYEIKLAAYYISALRILSATRHDFEPEDPDFVESATLTRRLGRNPFNRPSMHNLLGGPELQRLFSESVPRRLSSVMADTVLDYYRAVAVHGGKTDARFFAEKCSLLDDVRYGFRAMMGPVREIVLVRDPRDLLCSTRDFWKFNPDTAYQFLRESLPGYMAIRAQRSPDVMLLRYEDLVLTPDTVHAALRDFIGLTDSITPANEATLFARHATSQNPAASIGRWKQELPPEVAARCQDEFQAFMRAFDYTAEKPGPRAKEPVNGGTDPVKEPASRPVSPEATAVVATDTSKVGPEAQPPEPVAL
jgi:hypothetical protein